jgi:hypothetical protein
MGGNVPNSSVVEVPISLAGYPPDAVVTYAVIKRFADEGEDSPTLEQLADRLHCSTTAVARRLVKLNGLGLYGAESWHDGRTQRTRRKLRVPS